MLYHVCNALLNPPEHTIVAPQIRPLTATDRDEIFPILNSSEFAIGLYHPNSHSLNSSRLENLRPLN